MSVTGLTRSLSSELQPPQSPVRAELMGRPGVDALNHGQGAIQREVLAGSGKKGGPRAGQRKAAKLQLTSAAYEAGSFYCRSSCC